MTLPIVRPQIRFYSQRIDGRPYVNCHPYSICPVLRWMGYDVPDTFGMTLRKASGVPVAPDRGTSRQDMQRAIAKELPDAPVKFGELDEAALFNLLPKANRRNRRKGIVSVVLRMERLAKKYRRHVGYTWEGWHAVCLGGQQTLEDGTQQVYIMDPMGRTYRGYKGEWINYASIKRAASKTPSGAIKAIYGIKQTAA